MYGGTKLGCICSTVHNLSSKIGNSIQYEIAVQLGRLLLLIGGYFIDDGDDDDHHHHHNCNDRCSNGIYNKHYIISTTITVLNTKPSHLQKCHAARP